MIPNTLNNELFNKQTRLTQQGIREANSLTTYLRTQATPAEKAAYEKATRPGTKAGAAPKTILQLRKLL